MGDSNNSLDPYALGEATTWLAFDRLLWYDDTFKAQPELAETWELSPDSKQLKLNLRKGVTFHSGRDFTSADVAYNLQRVRDPKLALYQYNMANWITSVQTPDPYSVVVTLDQSRPTILDLFEWMCIVDKDTIDGPNGKTTSVGTGPFVYSEWVQGDHLRYTRNKNYWRSGRPYLDEVVIHVAKDPASMVLQLESGALDTVSNPSLQDQARLGTDPKYQVLRTAGYAYYALTANVTRPPTDNPKVREALNYALDRKRFAETIVKGASEPLELPWPHYSPAYDAAKNSAHAFDLDKAKSALAQSGATNVEMDFTYPTTFPELAQLGQIYQQDLAQIGVKLTLKGTDTAGALDVMQKVAYTGIAAITGMFSQLQPGTLFVVARMWNYMANQAGYKSDQYAQLVQQSVTEPDAAKRQAIYSQLNDVILGANAWLLVASDPGAIISRANLHDVRLDVGGARVLTDAWLG
ncbi:MAG TPA: ABC transporter substrate-binding protein [Chloroflexota bacterium]|nr:ABC transporter substrate-binding protein [Chloroflexota bacterium]